MSEAVAERSAVTRSAIGRTGWRTAIIIIVVVGLLAGSNAIEYFTIESNILVVGYFVAALVLRGRSAAPAPRLRGAMTSYILLTSIVYHFVLNGGTNPIPGLFSTDPGAVIQNWSQFLLHYVSPAMVLIEWVAWGPHGRVRWIDGVIWAAYPLGYVVVILVRGFALPNVSDRYPYPFLNPTIDGWNGVGATIVEVTIVYAVIVVVIVGLDRLLARVDRREYGPVAGISALPPR